MQRFDTPLFQIRGFAVLTFAVIVAAAADADAQPRRKAGFISGITRTDQLPTQELRDARKRMVKNKRISYRQLQVLADRGDSLAALLVAKQLYQKPELEKDSLHYFTMAAAAGRSGAIKPLVSLVRKIQPDPANQKRLGAAETALRAHAARGDEAAFEGLMSAYRSGTPFENSPVKYAEFRVSAAHRGNATAALEEAINLMSTNGTISKRSEIEAYLMVAERSSDLKTQSVAGALRRKLTSAAAMETPKSGDMNE
ncbi:hypothetical protein RMS29_017175 [Agrobacterium rosae]|uniref:Uncharacterized protein n=1 Tax=Agrobacterium rosae TaxID=1972867 RepID=A0AAE5RVE3_9HYPH|nr:hypothetical protein [Agrobacterium rosae]KAA3515372.1 hypothetical protein DXM21_00665 [Agrobacterium rosae]KAA3524339.1 hypothetical protein DXM25_00665 [Agrobacterium rosae]MCM2431234.1 hypothetical protein [Agrobacterium rosae]MDX8312744.1 hypothetical protein [Agrobacterium rosae]MDX8329100.1 hypothetical protein [Agrobacterium rosae]